MACSATPRRRSARLHTLAWLLWVFVLGLVLQPSAASATDAISATDSLADTLTQAEFRATPARPWQPVALPDTWKQRGLPAGGQGQYRLRFALQALPAQPWGLLLARVSSSRRVLLNGHEIELIQPDGRRHAGTSVIELPTAALHPGDNEIVIEVNHRVRGGLSSAEIGPASLLHAQSEATALWTRELPRSINMGMGVLGLIMLLVRWRRPSERAIGLFGAVGLIGSVRNYSYFGDVTVLPAAVTDWLYFCAQVWTVALFVAYAHSLSRRHTSVRLRTLCGAALALPLLLAFTLPTSTLPTLRLLVYPLLLLACALAVARIWQAARSHGELAHYALIGSLLLVLAAGVHDYLFQIGRLPVTDTFWLPFVMPIALVTVSALLLNRLVDAMGDVELLNATLERRVGERTRALEAANTAKSRFLAAASHDLRQPVAAIGLLVGLLRERVGAPEVRGLIDRADDAVSSLEGLLRGLLDLSRLDSGAWQPQIHDIALQPLFDAIQAHAAPTAQAKGLRLRFRPTKLAVCSDPVLLEQMLRNLVHNAVSHTARGGVLVTARRRGTSVHLQVRDSGPGIAPELQASVFDEFVQLDNPGREASRGFGLGLSILKRSAALLGHPVSLRSTPGRGSCFGLELPATALPLRQLEFAAAGTGLPLAGCTLLLLEDHDVVREALALRLRAWGAEVRSFARLGALLDWLNEDSDGSEPPDLLLTDHRLPDGDGLQAIDAARRRWPKLPVLVVTGDTGPQESARLAERAVPLLRKPFRVEALRAAIVRSWSG